MLLALTVLLAAIHCTLGASLNVDITPRFSGEPVQPDSLRYQTSSGESFSITRVSYLLSGFALERADGSWCELTNRVAWMDLENGRSSIQLANVPADAYRSIRFQVGLDPEANHADPAKFPADHPLNPNLNGLHWSWQGGYIFVALEGRWRNPAVGLDGWAYHLARDTNSVRVLVAASIDVTNETRLDLDFDVAAVLNAPCPLSFAADGSSTHSRDSDPIAAALVKNLTGAFRFRKVTALSESEIAAVHPKPLYLPETFTPQPFQMSATFPIPDLPRDNPLTIERVELGRALFFDPRLSINDAQSCADCHSPKQAFSDGRATSPGAEGQFGKRNAMTLVNLAWKKSYFWDGRAPRLRDQVLQPIQDPIEMHESLTNLAAKLEKLSRVSDQPDEAGNPKSEIRNPKSSYPALFARAFGSREITSEKIALALENYLLTLTSFNAKFDRVLRGEEKFTAEEQRGFELFATEYDPRRGQFGADCFHCHGGPLFQSQSFANNGLDLDSPDAGRAKVTGREADRGKFSVPSLRNIALTAPYMHDGRFGSLDEVMEHYSTGVKRAATLDPNLAKHPDGGVPLSASDRRALVAFLKSLTDEAFASSNP